MYYKIASTVIGFYFLILNLATFAETPDPVLSTLPSGQRVVTVSNPNSTVVTLDTWVDTGSVNETAENNGVSHFLEHLLFKGTPTLQPGDLDRLLERRGAHFNAATSDDYTHYHLTTPVAHFDEALRLHADMLLNASLRKDDVDRERPVVQEEIHRATDNPSHDLFQTLTRHLFGKNHPYALDTLGPKALIGTMPLDDIRAYYRCWYRPEHLTTIVAGGVTPEQAQAAVANAFKAASLSPTSCHPAQIPAPDYPKQPIVEVLTHPQLSDAKLILAFPSASLSEASLALKQDALAEILTGGKTARLVKNLREDKGWVTDISAGNSTQRYGGAIMISADMAPNRVLDVAREIKNELDRLQTSGITSDELQRVKTAVDREFVYLNESTESVAGTVGYYASLAQLSDYTQYRARVAALSQADLNATAKTAFPEHAAVLLVMLPEKETDAAIDQSLLKEKLRQILTQPPSSESTNTSSLTSTSSPKSAIFKTQLAQGPTLIVKSLPEASTVAITVSIPGGSSVEKTPGTAALTAHMLTKGSTTRTLEQLNTLLDDRQMSLSVSAGADATQAEGVSVTEDWPLLLNTLVDVLQHPAFEREKLAQEQALTLQALSTSLDAPSALMFDRLNSTLYGPKSPYGVSVDQTFRGVKTLNRHDLQAYHRNWLSPERWIISVVGNVTPEIVQQTLSGLLVTPRQAKPFENLPMSRDVGVATPKSPIINTRPKLAATWIGQAWLGPSVTHTQDYLALKVINSLMGSGMSSVLFRTLREQQSLAYQVGSSYGGKRLPSGFVMYLGTAPQNEQKAIDGFETQRQRLLSGDFTDAELDDAKSKLAGAFAVAHETPAAQAEYLALFETLGLGAEFDRAFPKRVQAITRADVLRVASRYLSGPPVISIVKPESAP